MFRAHLLWSCISVQWALWLSVHISTLIGLGAMTPGDQCLGIVFSSVAHQCRGLWNTRPLSSDPALRLHIYCVITNAVADCSWLRQLLREIHVIIQKATMAFYDVISTIYMTHNLVHHHRLEHIELDMRSWEGGHWWSSCDTCTH